MRLVQCGQTLREYHRTSVVMLPFKLIYSDGYYLPIGAHVFPAEKYRLVQQRLRQKGIAEADDFLEPQPASDDDIRLVHTKNYVHKLLTGTLSSGEIALLELPYSKQLVAAFWLAAGGSILAAECALRDSVAFNIGGGFHHAHPDHGEGFCMIHDVAVAIRRMQKEGQIARAMTVDCDVHHGNGTAAIFPPSRDFANPLPSAAPGTSPTEVPHRSQPHREGWEGERGASAVQREQSARAQQRSVAEPLDQTVFTISLHQQNNYPMFKPPSAIDVNLPDGTDDDQYLHWLDNALSSGLRQFTPDHICNI